MPTNEDVIKAFNLGFIQGNEPYQIAKRKIEDQAKEIKRLKNKCKAERKKKERIISVNIRY